jgi:RNA polymerase-binding transcription factor DksA
MHYRYLTLEQRENLARLIGACAPQELGRLRTPEYGVCSACGADIAYARLLEFPAALYCAACQPKNA